MANQGKGYQRIKSRLKEKGEPRERIRVPKKLLKVEKEWHRRGPRERVPTDINYSRLRGKETQEKENQRNY